ncbi:MAG: glycosyltransferase [Chromatiaceae bacterium]|nr:MAG: glycosyltransferase [Chromatiaceae bacterium]
MLRVLIIAHAHPDFSHGGAEIAAYQLFEHLRKSAECDAWFLACHQHPGFARPGAAFAIRSKDQREILYDQSTDYFDFSASNLRFLAFDLPALLREIRPDVVHFHHYVNVGVETFRVVRNELPTARILLTLHEFLAICNRQGQMLKTNGRLCERAHPQDCHLCMPERPPPDYFLRERYIKSLFSEVDHFISPSEFLKARYAAWGLAAERIFVIENGQPADVIAPRRDSGSAIQVFGHFGQITPYKGVDVLLAAFARLPARTRQRCRLQLHGGGHHGFPGTFARRIEQAIAAGPQELIYRGPYQPQDLPRRMAGVDWVIVPSLWWENSPMVIQEAFRHGRPVICSNIGGMAEKVRDGVDGVHFAVGDPDALCSVLCRIIDNPALLDQLQAGIAPPPTIAATARQCLSLYRGDR